MKKSMDKGHVDLPEAGNLPRSNTPVSLSL